MIPLGILASSVRRASAALLAPTDLVATLVEPAVPDPYWDNVVALLHMDSDQFYDEVGKQWVPESGAEFDALIKRFGSGSAYFNGIGSGTLGVEPRLITQNSPAYQMGSDDFTIESFIYPKKYPESDNYIGGLYSTTDNQRSWAIAATSSGTFEVLLSSTGTSAQLDISGGYCPVDKWTHVAVTRQAGLVRIFVDGAVVNSAVFPNHLHPSSSPLTIGAMSNGAYGFNGNIDEVRITKGVARYTENFTPPSEPFPNFGSEPTPTPLPTVIGEPYGGGFYAGDIQYPDGQWYKLIVADVSADITGANSRWKTERSATAGTDSLTDGVANTTSMIAAGAALHPAANHCVNHTGGGNSDWYMPAKDELNVIYLNLGFNQPNCPADFLGGGPQAFANAYYWASTAYSASSGWIQRFSSGNQPSNYKNSADDRVRPIRRIAFTPD